MFTNLPSSGIRVVVTEVAYELAEGRVFPEHKGLTPNIVVAPGEDALGVALAPIR
jgi:hypothetical protein